MMSPLAAWLAKTGKSHAELARRIGVTDSAVWRWAHNKRRPGLQAAFAIEAETRGAVKARDLLRQTSRRTPSR